VTRVLEALIVHGEGRLLAGCPAEAAACWFAAIDSGRLHPAQGMAVQMVDALALDEAARAAAAEQARTWPADAAVARILMG